MPLEQSVIVRADEARALLPFLDDATGYIRDPLLALSESESDDNTHELLLTPDRRAAVCKRITDLLNESRGDDQVSNDYRIILASAYFVFARTDSRTFDFLVQRLARQIAASKGSPDHIEIVEARIRGRVAQRLNLPY